MCSYPSLTYAAQTRATTQKQLNKICRTQLAMECSITGTELKDRVRSGEIGDLTGTKNIKYVFKKLKLKYVRHIKHNKEDRWERRVLEWTPYGNKRKKGRPKRRWKDEIKRMGGMPWCRLGRKG